MRNNLFSKDIVTTKILVDSMSLDHSKDFNPSHFTVDFGGEKSDGTKICFPDTYKNVIGFRLLKCTIPITPYHIHEGDANHHTLSVSVGEVTQSVSISPGVFTATSLKTAAETAIKSHSSITAFTVSFNIQTHKFTFTNGIAHSVTIHWALSPVLARVFGFYMKDKIYENSKPVESEYVGDFNTTFVDLVINEIPRIACKDNPNGKVIIDRIPLQQNSENMSRTTYVPNISEYYTQNFFYPMKLGRITIQLLLDHETDIVYDSQKGETSFEFELTILKNTKLMETSPNKDETNLVAPKST